MIDRRVWDIVTDILGGAPLRAFESLRRWRRRDKAGAERRRAIAELEGLDDRTLQDIGVNRRSIRELVDAQLQAEAQAEAEAEAQAEAEAAVLSPAVAGIGGGAGSCPEPC